MGIMYLKAGTLKGIHIVELGSGDIKKAFGVNYHADSLGFHHNIAFSRFVLEVYFVLQSRASASDNGNAKHSLRASLLGQKRDNLVCRGLCHADDAFVCDFHAMASGKV